jgi:hypothetical protein
LSSDDQLHDEAPITDIPYAEHFHKYVEYLREGLAGKDDAIVALFADWNALFFPNGTGGGEPDEESSEEEDDEGAEGPQPEDGGDGHDAALRRLREDRARKQALAEALGDDAETSQHQGSRQASPGDHGGSASGST